MKETLNEILQRMMATVDKGIDFLSAELPEVVMQLLLWHGVYSLVWFSLGLGVMGICARLFYKLWGNPNDWDDEGHTILMGFLGIFSIIGGIVAICNLTWLKILIAPKLYLLEYAASLVK